MARGIRFIPEGGALGSAAAGCRSAGRAATNVEAVVKVLDACGLNNRFWVFAGGLTDVNVVLMVTDTQTGNVKTYTNPQGTAFRPIQDTNALPCQ